MIPESSTRTNLGETKTPIKTHVLWALVTGGVGLLSWKGSQFLTKYKMLKEKSKTN